MPLVKWIVDTSHGGPKYIPCIQTATPNQAQSTSDPPKTSKGPFKDPLKRTLERNKTNNLEQLSAERFNVLLSDIEYLIKYWSCY